MGTFVATAADASLVADLLTAFNAEFESPSPQPDDLERRLAAMLALPEVLVIVSGTRDAPTGFALATMRPTPYHDGPLAVLDELYVIAGERDRGVAAARPGHGCLRAQQGAR